MTEMMTTVGSTMASFMFAWAIIRQYCPYELCHFLEKYGHRLASFFYPYIQVSIHEFTETRLQRSEAYATVEAYLSANSSQSAKRLKAEMGKDSEKLVLSMDEYEKVTDEFQGVKITWASCKTGSTKRSMGYGNYQEQDKRYYRLTFRKRYREMMTEAYLGHVMKQGKEIRHPATFETMAMETEKKQEIVEDLLAFSQSKDFYARIGKAWKREYLLYGPPGTGKSTVIAAMANLLSYHVYDLELTAVKDNTELRKLLIETTSKSIIVIEDIDCSLDLTGQRKKTTERPAEDKNEQGEKEAYLKEPKEERTSRVTLSGLLNFIDGLWSASGGERIIVFTTNYVEKLDPALIRRGRMDKHIELSYCSFEGFKVLAKNYLRVEAHPLFELIERLMEEIKITPADVAETLMPKSAREDAEKCLSNLIRALEEVKKKADLNEAKESLREKEPEKEPAKEDQLLQDKQEAEKPL
ncbi:P-loop containing nucleoside triphosphate hydrolases superfamily protein [Actinidia rufa]|uniref:P-loop containing nucleoside triphosphate hydrolases superfamily protein n=1 Tax=Actinidia rufa TaxID=165716 RepID=A0A7J0DDL3_9ERIC|nr:P-loop containing nucleoside triphosphate hydrolases superfamily protein [Actinidia rufa]